MNGSEAQKQVFKHVSRFDDLLENLSDFVNYVEEE